MDAREEADLLTQVRAGDRTALGEAYTRYADEVMRIAWRLTGSSFDAEDVVHDVFLGLPEALARYEERGSFRAWIRVVATRTALMRLRRGARRNEVPLDDAPELPAASSGHSPESRAAFRRALERLPEPQRLVFVLKEMEGYSHAEVGALLGISEGASEVRLCRATKQLRHALRGR
jgi:RNA polymerase sigma-70 factor (ECF subfamily)